MTYGDRLEVYLAQTGRTNPTPGQRRRLMKKLRRFSPPLFPGEPGSGKQEIPAQ